MVQADYDILGNRSLLYYPTFFSLDKAGLLQQKLTNTIKWQTREITLFGRTMLMPRLTAWYGDEGIAYTYSNNKEVALPWTEDLLSIKKKLETELNASFNSVLLNLYRDGNDSMGWHADNEPELGKHPIIASISLGATRRFRIKNLETKETHALDLTHGSLVVMQGDFQEKWHHAISKTKREIGPRINLTFRRILD